MTADPRARRAAFQVSALAAVLSVAKLIVGALSGSIAVLSSGLDSAGDTVASFVNFMFLRIASKPADEGHQFGHEKAEHLAALFQGIVLFTGAVFLAIKAWQRIRQPHPIEASGIAIATMILSTAASIAIGVYLKRTANKVGSAALAADALHYTSDVVSNGAAMISLLLVQYTHNSLFDPIFGLPIAGWIGYNGLRVLSEAAGDLMDRSLPEEEIQTIVEAIEASDPTVIGFDMLRTRRAAGTRFVEFELMIDRNVSFEHAHDVTERVKQMIHESFPRVVVTVHAEPVNVEGRQKAEGRGKK